MPRPDVTAGEPKPVPIDPFRVDGSIRRDLHPVAEDPQLEALLTEQKCRELCRRIEDEAHFQRWITKSATDLGVPTSALERRLRPCLPWEDPNPPAVPIPASPDAEETL